MRKILTCQLEVSVGGPLLFKSLTHKVLNSIGLDLVKTDTLSRLIALEAFPPAIDRWLQPRINAEVAGYVLSNLGKSKAQLQQDLLVQFIYEKIELLEGNASKTFIEFGAASGVALSNTYFLEKIHRWTGLLCEPHPGFRESIEKNRTCDFDTRCVSTSSGQTIEFLLVNNPELSTIKSYSESDLHSQSRLDNSIYFVRTVSLDDLVKERFEKDEIFYLSVDTEGSEFEILQSYSFEKYPRVISVEHNFTENDAKIELLLKERGYSRILRSVSEFDAWYLHNMPNFQRDYLTC